MVIGNGLGGLILDGICERLTEVFNVTFVNRMPDEAKNTRT